MDLQSIHDKGEIEYLDFEVFIPEKNGLRREVIQTDIPAKIHRLEIPVYFFSGRYDLTVNKDLSKEYLKKIGAPVN